MCGRYTSTGAFDELALRFGITVESGTNEESGLFSHAHRRNGALYEQLFRANNLPAMTAPGAEYYPVWTRAEVDALAQVLRLGISEVRHQLSGAGAV